MAIIDSSRLGQRRACTPPHQLRIHLPVSCFERPDIAGEAEKVIQAEGRRLRSG